MATETSIKYVDDIDGGPAKGTVQFSIDGKAMEIDLSEENETKLREALAQYVAAGRRASNGNVGTPPRGARRAQNTADRERNQAIRAWANANGHSVAKQGRIPQDIVIRYDNRETASA